ncbi:glycosyltransferase family 39 protein [Asticcacaulis sp. EMRT-3]|uniref:ArnT family glycosyltransferase n=1 Tax=Asticcacaulis sp. EMRT-3 TaxID=3040349 RepID=UPI0024AF84C2|nr:glycosyltransferase family 39 protein [Asticcacaulis sp. EMRT-3]MDI7776100.1 glycosyltransferase family 39 protein [Asticcacaulis sp. EMRT-3]
MPELDKLHDLNATPATLGPQKPLFGDERQLLRVAIALWLVLLVWKFSVGLISHVIWEESHFVMSGQYLALGYPDIPAGFPWLARLITTIFGWHIWPLRLVGLAIAMAIPWAVWFMATPVTSQRNALWAAIISMLIPAISLNGTIFYPEGALQLLLALMLGCILRGMKGDGLKWWIWAGVCAGIGQLVHFRFLVPGLAVVVYMLADRHGRTLWTHKGVWITAAIGLLGLLPAFIYNAQEGWPAIEFHVIRRPHYDPDPKHVLSLIETQFAIWTPLFFIAIWGAVKHALWPKPERDDKGEKLPRRPSGPEALLAWQVVVIFLFYALQATVNKKVMPHWPFMAAIPMLPMVPGVLIRFTDKARTLNGRRLRAVLIATGPLLALLIGVAATGYQILYDNSAKLTSQWRAFNILKNEDWTLLEPALHKALVRTRVRFGGTPVIATNGHIAAVHLEFPADHQKGRRVYTLGDPYDDVSMFSVARHDWHLDRQALMTDHAGGGVVLALLEPSYIYHEPEQTALYTQLCKDFDAIEPEGITALPPYRTAIDFFTARVRTSPLSDAEVDSKPCPLVPQLYIAHPTRGDFISHDNTSQLYGMAADPKGVTAVDILLDGKVVAHAHYGIDEKSHPAPNLLKYDPNWPRLQYTYSFPKGSLKVGTHTLSARATRSDGTTFEADPRVLYVE